MLLAFQEGSQAAYPYRRAMARVNVWALAEPRPLSGRTGRPSDQIVVASLYMRASMDPEWSRHPINIPSHKIFYSKY